MFQCVFSPLCCLSCYRTIDIVSGGPDLSVSMLSWPIVALFNNVVQLPGDESWLVHSVDPLRHRSSELADANAMQLQTPTPIETTVHFGSAETYLPLQPNSLLPYEPSLPSSPTSFSAIGDRWPVHANVNATLGQPSVTSRGLDMRFAVPDLQDPFQCLTHQHYLLQESDSV